MTDTLTAQEEKAIADLKAIARRWPKSLWLFSANGSLCVMRAGPNGEHVRTPDGGIDPQYEVDQIEISNSGGDW